MGILKMPPFSQVRLLTRDEHAHSLCRCVGFLTKDEKSTRRLSSLRTHFFCSAINEEGFTNEKLSYFKSKTYLCDPLV